MADTLATLGLRLDAEGMVVGVRRVRGELTELGVSGRQVQARVKTFATESAFALSSLAGSGTRDLTQVAKSLSGLGFAFGAQVGIITLAVSSIADAFSEQARKTKEEQDKMLAELRSFVGRYSQEMLRIQIAAKEARISQLQGQGEGGLSPLQRFGRQFMRGPFQQELASPFQDRIQTMTDDVHKLRLRLVEVQREAQRAFDEKAPERFARSLHSVNEGFDGLISRGLKDYARRLADAADEAEQFRKAFSDPATGAFGKISQTDLDAIAAGVKKTADALEDAARKAERMKENLKNMAIGAGVSLVSRLSPELGGVLQGGVSGFMMAGAPGAALGAGMGLVDMLFGIADSAKQAREAIRQLRAQFEAFSDGQKEALGILSAVSARTNELRRAYQEQREALKALIAGFVNQTNPARVEEYNRRLRELNALEAARAEQLQREVAELNKIMQEDLKLRLLQAQGRTAEADALALALKQQREYAQAVKDGADATTLAALSEVQRAEKLAISMAKIQQRIDSLSATITGLQDFRDQLKLSGTESPTDRLAEARKQYATILSKAQGFTIPGLDGLADVEVPPDQAAAARLPAAAQALLEASRLVNASGKGFQDDLLSVLKDTEGLITKFSDLRAVEELMLDELKRIAAATEASTRIQEELIKPVGKLPTVGGASGSGSGQAGGSGSTEALLTVSQSGFAALIQKVEALSLAVETSARETRRAVTALT